MITEEIKNTKAAKPELRRFGLTIGTVLVLLGGLFLWREKKYYEYIFLLAGVFFLAALIRPIWLRSIHKIWMSLAILLSWIMTHLILTILFYLIVTPLGLTGRLCRRRFLDIKFPQEEVPTFLIQKTKIPRNRKDY